MVAATRSGARAEGLLEWAFGAGSQGVTPVGLLGSRYFEHRISYYTIPKRLSFTIAAFGKLAGSQTVGQQVQFGLKLLW